MAPVLLERLRSSLSERYTLDHELGRGGMAIVFLAHDLKHDRKVALKVLHPELSSGLGPERFLREIKLAARLNHPHIVPVHDSGTADDLLYYVMPYIKGESLRQRLIRSKTLELEEALSFASDIAAALDYAHRQGVVHRDIKPENVMIHEGEALVADFGIAKAVKLASDDGTTGAVGTMPYMSPEQAGGDPGLDGRSDIYSLGCVLYEMLTGAPPFAGPALASTKKLSERMTSLRSLRELIPQEVEGAIRKALSASATDRFATAAELANALASRNNTTKGRTQSNQGTVVGAPAKSIAVLPFVDMSPAHDQTYFCEGVAEEIMNALTKIKALQVASRSSAFAFRGQNVDIRKVGEQLGVNTVLEGSVRKAGNKIRISAQLVNVADGYGLWSERFDREMEDVFAIQDEIAQSIVRVLRVILSEEEKRTIGKVSSRNVQAYEYYLRGRQVFHQFRRTTVQLARRMFERAKDIDPEYALAYAGASDCCSVLYMYWDASQANLEGADAYSKRALELEPDLAEAHVARGLAVSLSERHREAEVEFETAIRLNPKLFEAHYFHGRALFQQGNLVAAIEAYQEASRVRPDDYQSKLLAVQVLRSLGRPAEAEVAMREGVQAAVKHLELNPDDVRARCLGAVAWIQLGDRDKAFEWAQEGLRQAPDDSSVLYNIACIYALGGHTQRAIDCLQQAVENGFGHRAWLENDSDLESLRSDPRFTALLAKL